MQSLAAGVGDLKRVLTNVKSRGTWGEVQLARLIQDTMTPDQYASNVKPVPGSDAIVEFAIRLPGRAAGAEPVWLPIDAKFPKEEYERLMDACDAADPDGERAAGRSEEHTSELQSLMRISYAVFCLKKKQKPQYTDNTLREHNNNKTNQR